MNSAEQLFTYGLIFGMALGIFSAWSYIVTLRGQHKRKLRQEKAEFEAEILRLRTYMANTVGQSSIQASV